MLIGGKWVDAKSGARIAIENPAKKVTIAEVPRAAAADVDAAVARRHLAPGRKGDRKSTRLNSSHQIISYAVFCLKKKNETLYKRNPMTTIPPRRNPVSTSDTPTPFRTTYTEYTHTTIRNHRHSPLAILNHRHTHT